MEVWKLIAISLAAAFALAAWLLARIVRGPLQDAAEEAHLGKDSLKRLQSGWLPFIGGLISLGAMLITSLTPAPPWVALSALTLSGAIMAIHCTRLLRAEAEDSPICAIAERRRRLSLAFAAMCAVCAAWLLVIGIDR